MSIPLKDLTPNIATVMDLARQCSYNFNTLQLYMGSGLSQEIATGVVSGKTVYITFVNGIAMSTRSV